MMPDTLNIFYDEELIGTLHVDYADDFELSYAASWLAAPGAFDLSFSLPLSDVTYRGEVVRSFFDNLLPEGEARQLVCNRLQLSQSNIFGLLLHLGKDCAGALSLLPPEEKPGKSRWGYTPISNDELELRLQNTLNTTSPFFADVECARLSLAGAQAKLPVYDDGAVFHMPMNGAPSNCILKPDISRYQGSAINEHLCMELARAVRLPAARTRFFMVNDKLPCLAVERYDRQVASPFPRRLHQEDFCQICGRSRLRKYEADGGPGLARIRELLPEVSTAPGPDRKLILRWYLFNLLIGNMDAHAKNLSLLYLGPERRLAPFYDLLSTTYFPNLDRVPAMSPLGQKVTLNAISRNMWRDCAARFGVRRQQPYELLESMREKLLAALPQVVSSLRVPEGVPLSQIAEHLQKEIQTGITS